MFVPLQGNSCMHCDTETTVPIINEGRTVTHNSEQTGIELNPLRDHLFDDQNHRYLSTIHGWPDESYLCLFTSNSQLAA